jgi:hypothetical protein
VQIDELKEALTLQMMMAGGFDPDNREESPLEWDLNTKDSQYSICKDIADSHVDFVLTQIMSIPSPEAQEDVENEDYLDFEYEDNPLDSKKTNTTSAALFIFMDAGNGNPRYVSDVRQWLANVDKAGIPDDTEIEGQLYLSYDIEGSIETIECGECGYEETLISSHNH